MQCNITTYTTNKHIQCNNAMQHNNIYNKQTYTMQHNKQEQARWSAKRKSSAAARRVSRGTGHRGGHNCCNCYNNTYNNCYNNIYNNNNNNNNKAGAMDSEWRQAADGRGRVYYYNTATKETQWERPAALDKSKDEDKSKSKDNSKGPWRRATTAEGKTYFYHAVTKQTRWDDPARDARGGHEQVQEEPQQQPQQQQHSYSNESPLLHVATTTPSDRQTAEAAFVAMLHEHGVDATWSFSRIITELGTTDARYWLVDDDPLWKQALFEQYLSNRSRDQLLRESQDVDKFTHAFEHMLRTKANEIQYHTTWTHAQQAIANEPIYKHSVIPEATKKRLVLEYIESLRVQHANKHKLDREQAISELKLYLRPIVLQHNANDNGSIIIISWNALVDKYLFDNNKRFSANKHFKLLTNEDVLTEYLTLVREFESNQQERLEQLQLDNYTNDRQARDDFKSLLQTATDQYALNVNTTWTQFVHMVQHEPHFINLIGRHGSSPLDLFTDWKQDQWNIINAKRSIAEQILIENNQDPHSTHLPKSTDPWKQILISNRERIDYGNIDLLIEQIINLAREKELKRKQASLSQRKHDFKIALQRAFPTVQSIQSLPKQWDPKVMTGNNIISNIESLPRDETQAVYHEFITEIAAINPRKRTKRESEHQGDLDY